MSNHNIDLSIRSFCWYPKIMEDIQKNYTEDKISRANHSPSIGLITRQKEPKVLETPLDRVDSFLTPTELFYVRSHSPAPKLELASYRLQVDGAVRSPFSLTYKELELIHRALPL
jgi:hypothetical protein